MCSQHWILTSVSCTLKEGHADSERAGLCRGVAEGGSLCGLPGAATWYQTGRSKQQGSRGGWILLISSSSWWPQVFLGLWLNRSNLCLCCHGPFASAPVSSLLFLRRTLVIGLRAHLGSPCQSYPEILSRDGRTLFQIRSHSQEVAVSFFGVVVATVPPTKLLPELTPRSLLPANVGGWSMELGFHGVPQESGGVILGGWVVFLSCRCPLILLPSCPKSGKSPLSEVGAG